MGYPELNRYSYVRAFREVIPSTRLEKLTYQLGRAALLAVAPKASTWLRLPEDSENGTTGEQVIEGIDMPKIKIYEADKLWLTQFEVIMPRSERSNRKLDRLYARIKNSSELRAARASLKKQHDIAEPLQLRVQALAECTIPEHANLGREFGLPLAGPRPALDFLAAEEEIIYNFVNHTGIGSELRRYQRPRPKILPLFRLPPDINGAQTDRFLELAEGCIPADAVDIRLNVLDVRPKTPES